MKKFLVLFLVLVMLCGCTAQPTQTTAPETTAPQVQRELYVLMYHSVAPDGTECNAWTVTESTFRAHPNQSRLHYYNGF